MPNAIDITTIAAVKAWLGQTATTDDATIQDCITAFSAYALRLTGRGPRDGSIPANSPFVAPQNYNENYDGSGTDRLFLRNWPITAVSSLTVGPLTIPQSTSWNQPGWVIDQSAKNLVLRGGGGPTNSQGVLTVGFWNLRGYHGSRWIFVNGVQNVNVQYSAGFAAVPFDLEMAARKTVALNYKRKEWIGQRSRAMAQGAGTITFAAFEMDPDAQNTLEFYKRRSFS